MMTGRWRQWLGLGVWTPLPAREAYALWAETYPPEPHNPLMEAEQSVVAPIIAAAAPRRALDVGTGTGRYLTLLSAAGARFVAGVDLSLPMLEHGRCRTPRVCGDACRLPFIDGSFDFVCASLMAGDVMDLGPWIAEATRVLAPGGHLVYSDFHPSWSVQEWQRTFRAADGRGFELSYFPHTIDQHLQDLEDAALEVRAIREPRVINRSTPVVAVFHAVKPAPATMRRRPDSPRSECRTPSPGIR